jgi:hypothetical protein
MTNPINNRIGLLPALDLGKPGPEGVFVKRVSGPPAGISEAPASSTRSSGPCDMSHDATGRGPSNRAMVRPRGSETSS